MTIRERSARGLRKAREPSRSRRWPLTKGPSKPARYATGSRETAALDLTPDQAALAVEPIDCPNCDAPAGSACRTRGGTTAAKYHTPRFVLVPHSALRTPRGTGDPCARRPRPRPRVDARPGGHGSPPRGPGRQLRARHRPPPQPRGTRLASRRARQARPRPDRHRRQRRHGGEPTHPVPAEQRSQAAGRGGATLTASRARSVRCRARRRRKHERSRPRPGRAGGRDLVRAGRRSRSRHRPPHGGAPRRPGGR